jgi:hypothetical protein
MAPVAGGITYGKEDGLIFLLCFLKSLLPPGIPIHRIIGMLQQVGTFLKQQPI